MRDSQNRDRYIDLYKAFRKELDNICIPEIIKEVEVQPIYFKGDIVGIICSEGDYIDCLYIQPEYRRKGIGRQAVLDWIRKHNRLPERLHIINKNIVAKEFWCSLFELEPIGTNNIDTLYEICWLRDADAIAIEEMAKFKHNQRR